VGGRTGAAVGRRLCGEVGLGLLVVVMAHGVPPYLRTTFPAVKFATLARSKTQENELLCRAGPPIPGLPEEP
jgi:hypothetical protein